MLGFPFGRRALPRLDAQRVRRRKNARGKNPRAPAKHVRIRRSPPTEAALHPFCRWRSPDRHRDRIGHSCPNRSRSGDLDLQRDGPDRQIQPYRLHPLCRWRSPDRHRDRIRRCCFYFACFTSPNVVNARCAGDTGPRNRRVTNVSGLPPNETSSIW